MQLAMRGLSLAALLATGLSQAASIPWPKDHLLLLRNAEPIEIKQSPERSLGIVPGSGGKRCHLSQWTFQPTWEHYTHTSTMPILVGFRFSFDFAQKGQTFLQLVYTAQEHTRVGPCPSQPPEERPGIEIHFTTKKERPNPLNELGEEDDSNEVPGRNFFFYSKRFPTKNVEHDLLHYVSPAEPNDYTFCYYFRWVFIPKWVTYRNDSPNTLVVVLNEKVQFLKPGQTAEVLAYRGEKTQELDETRCPEKIIPPGWSSEF
jgi:hypothetical protein